jgi:hypothetical protein
MKMATPPRRGSGALWRCLSWEGTATHPRTVAKSRTDRVKMNAKTSETRKMAKNMTVNRPPRPPN